MVDKALHPVSGGSKLEITFATKSIISLKWSNESTPVLTGTLLNRFYCKWTVRGRRASEARLQLSDSVLSVRFEELIREHFTALETHLSNARF